MGLEYLVVAVAALGSTAFPCHAQLSDWELSPDPMLVVGERAGQELGWVSHAVRWPNGTLAFLDLMQNMILQFDPSGTPLGPLAGPGEGPGELLRPLSIRMVSGWLVLVDPASRRVTYFDQDGTVVSELTLATPFGVGEAVRLIDGSWLVRRTGRMGAHNGQRIERDLVTYYRLNAELGEPRPFTRAPGPWGTSTLVGGVWRNGFVPFSPDSYAAALGSCVLITASDVPSVRVIPVDGEERSVKYEAEARPVTAALKSLFIERGLRSLEEGDEKDAQRKGASANLAYLDTLPLVQGMIVDPLGYVWLQRYEPKRVGMRVHVLSPDLVDLGVIELPHPMRLIEVGGDYLVGVAQDEFETQSVRLHRIFRPGRVPNIAPQCAA